MILDKQSAVNKIIAPPCTRAVTNNGIYIYTLLHDLAISQVIAQVGEIFLRAEAENAAHEQ